MRNFIFTLLVITAFANVNSGQPLVEQLGWLEGSWTTEKWGGRIDEYWSTPRGNNIIGSFRFVKEGKLNFTEHFIIIEEDNKLILKLKHFGPNFHGWEEKNEYVEFDFIEIDDNHVKFDGISYELINPDSMRVLVDLGDNNGDEPEAFYYKKMK